MNPKFFHSIILHVELTQVERFHQNLQSFKEWIDIQAIDPPLIVLNFNKILSQHGMNASHVTELLHSLFRISGERFHPHRIYKIQHCCNDISWIPFCSDIRFAKTINAVIRVIGYPKKLQSHVKNILIHYGYKIHSKNNPASHILYILTHQMNPYFLFGIEPVKDMYTKDTFASIYKSLYLNKQLIPCTAFYKIKEALSRYEKDFNIGPNSKILDIGASPGGWTQYLSSSYGANILAVDPGNMKIELNSNITHLSCMIEDAIHTSIFLSFVPFDLCVCDINAKPFDLVKIMREIAFYLKSNGGIICTLKFHRRPSKNVIDKTYYQIVQGNLNSSFKDMEMIWLHANTINERTLLARKK